MYAGFFQQGIYKSTNNGATWSAVNLGFLSNHTVVSIVYIGNVLFAGTDWDGIYMSTNNAASWSLVPDASMAHISKQCVLMALHYLHLNQEQQVYLFQQIMAQVLLYNRME